MGSACSSTPNPSPQRSRYNIIKARAPSVTSAELRHQILKSEVEEAKYRERIAQDMRKDFEKDRQKIHSEIQREMQAEKERMDSEMEQKKYIFFKY